MNTKAYREWLQSMEQLTRNQRKAGLGQLNVKASKKTKLTNWSKSPFTVARVARVNDWGGGEIKSPPAFSASRYRPLHVISTINPNKA